MGILRKLKETALSVAPLMFLVLAVQGGVSSFSIESTGGFVVGGLLVVAGLALFLLGTDLGPAAIGDRIGASLVKKRSLPLILAAGFGSGFIITIAEPAVQVLASQVYTVDPSIDPNRLLLMISLGVGLFVMIGLARVVVRIPLRWMLVVWYAILLILASFSDSRLTAIAFDAGGATTGPMTVPFVMALGAGVASVRKNTSDTDESFGLVGITSIGPVLAVVAMGFGGQRIASTFQDVPQIAEQAVSLAGQFAAMIPPVLLEVFNALLPLLVLAVVFQFTLLHLPFHRFARVLKGFVYTYIGLVLFMLGAQGGFLPVGMEIGSSLGSLEYNWVLVPLGLVLGAVVVLAEPTIWVLTSQVETISGGFIRRKLMIGALSIGVALAIGISMLRVITGIGIWWFLVPGYLASLVMAFRAPHLFTAIAFDSGGVVSGPLASTFILAFTLGASKSAGGDPVMDAFGVIAMIAMIPILTIQILGSMYQKSMHGKAVDHYTAGSGTDE